ncbi:acyl-CoA dehydrogenase family protein [Thioclava sp. GXIMD4216]|uniref:acyl-CoA dehydrogenase family protein n=1 Tax=Thioclava sp. GXIMD4216 TaxID=3131929 RepID=UPI0030CF5489
MDFSLSPEQQERNSHLARFAQDFAATCAKDPQSPSGFSRPQWDRLCAMGLAGLPLPETYGGTAAGALETIQSYETIARHIPDLGLLFSLCAHLFACVIPVWRGGTDSQKADWLPAMAQGRKIAANAISEEGSGSDVFAMKTRAEKQGGRYILNGTKRFITNAPVADMLVAYARTDATSSFFGISCFVLPTDHPGVTISAEESKSGLRSSPWGSVHFQDCALPESFRIGPEGAGASLFHESMVWERCCLFSIYLGAMERILALCLEHARTRVQFGRHIGANQAISNRLVDMRLKIETARLLLYKAAWLYDQGKPCEQTVALSKIWIAESAVQIGQDAMQIFGGEAMTATHPVNRFLNDAMPARIFSGSSEMQREIVARAMKLR